jgi:hypothetical protein
MPELNASTRGAADPARSPLGSGAGAEGTRAALADQTPGLRNAAASSARV